MGAFRDSGVQKDNGFSGGERGEECEMQKKRELQLRGHEQSGEK